MVASSWNRASLMAPDRSEFRAEHDRVTRDARASWTAALVAAVVLAPGFVAGAAGLATRRVSWP